MWAWPLLRFLGVCGFLLVMAGHGAVAAAQVGSVTRVQNQAQVGSESAAVGASVHMNDHLRTGANARLEVTFQDGTRLTLGENADVIVDRYVYNPAKSKGEMLLNASQGALRLATGKLKEMNNRDIKVATPYAALAVRGTEFWSGPIDGQYGALLLHGKVRVSNRAGAVNLVTPGQGTDIPIRSRR